MAKNNHSKSQKEIIEELELNFRAQTFTDTPCKVDTTNEGILLLKAYASIDHSVGVLSDLVAHKSYICVGSFGHFLGIEGSCKEIQEIDSIWEEEIYHKIHPEDLFERHLLELKFFHFLLGLPPEERLKYSTLSHIRALDQENNYHYIKHRTLYLQSDSSGTLGLALCLYNYSDKTFAGPGIQGKIINNETGESLPHTIYDNCAEILTQREKQILNLVGQGLLSKEICLQLNISQNTVNRHRQNIMSKLGVKNSTEAVRTALAMNLLP